MPQIPVMIVDDEVLAIEYLRGMIDWEAHGYPVVAEATNGRKALERQADATRHAAGR
jgi:two-component system response regulator YesN